MAKLCCTESYVGGYQADLEWGRTVALSAL